MKDNSLPLVSCIMPTYNRRRFVPNAIRYFLRQNYPNKELIIVDDGTDSIADLVPKHEQIRYIRLEKDWTLGEKRNFCIEQSKGSLIMHWDDDDWMADFRIQYQTNELIKSNVEVCGLQNMYFYKPDTNECWLYKYPQHSKPWLAGGSLLYTKEFWMKNPFPKMQTASDTAFIYNRKLNSYAVHTNFNFYIATIHPNNTSLKSTNSYVWQKISVQNIKNILGENCELYLNQTNNLSTNGQIPPEALSAIIPPKNDNSKLNGSEKSHLPDVTACLLSYKRPKNIQLIINSLTSYDFITEIIVWNNHKDKLKVHGKKIKIINSQENKICLGRFLCAQQATNEIIYVQDDDAIVHNIQELFSHFFKNPYKISYALSDKHYQLKSRYIYSSGSSALLGWGAFFKKSWIKAIDDFLKKNGESYLLKREADQFFSILQKQKHSPVKAKITHLNNHSTKNIALYREKDHYLYRAIAVNRALAFNRNSCNHKFPVAWNVVIPCKNYGDFLEEAIQSVLKNQADYIITIVNDGSNDNTEAIGKEYAQKYSFINYIHIDESRDVSYARNCGVASVDSLFVVFLDADDKIGENYLFEAERLLRGGCDIVNPDAILFGTQNARWEVPESVSIDMLCRKNYVHCSAAFRRSYWSQVGGVDEKMNNWQDYDFWIRLSLAGARIKKIHGEHFFYRKHGSSKSNQSALKRKEIIDYLKNKHTNLTLNL